MNERAIFGSLSFSSDATYTYDADGNQIAVQEASRSVTYHYNDLGRMSSAVIQSLGQTTLETYSYNGNGIRIAKNTDGIETRYLIDPNGSLSYVLAEYDADGNVTAYYTRGTELISRETSGEIRYYQYDPNGSVRLLTDASGDVSDTYTYDAFGSLIYQTGTSGNSFLFQGEQYDSATGLYYLRARYMNPTTGTFTSMDAFQGSTSDPMSLHKYLFANANPVMNSDPSGYLSKEEQAGAITMQMTLLSVDQAKVLEWGLTLLIIAGGLIAHLNSYQANVQSTLLLATLQKITSKFVMIAILDAYLAQLEFVKNAVDAIEKIIAASIPILKAAISDNSVYVLCNPADKGEVWYVGISNDAKRRETEHRRSDKFGEDSPYAGFEMYVVATGLSRPVARMYEQALICYYVKESLANARYEIASGNYDKFKNEIMQVASLLKVDELGIIDDILNY